jgi:undecaprenyl-diphosphatase
VCFVVAGVYFFRQRRSIQIELLIFGLSCAIISYGAALVAGLLYDDPRPFVMGHFTPLIPHDTGNGFPSDHVLLVSCLSVVIGFFNKRLSLLLWLFTLVIAYSRVYVGVHHYLDVVASIIIAVSVTSVIHLVAFRRYLVPAAEKFRAKYFPSRTKDI